MIWLIGSKSLLGSELAKQLTQHKIPWLGTNDDVNITNYQELESFEKTLETSSYYPSQLSHAQRKVQWIINCTEFSNIDLAESDVENCNSINTIGAQNIARLCRNVGCKLIQISSDNVYDGKKTSPYTEEDSVNPLNVYGKSKLQAETEISRLMNTYYIIRTSHLYDAYNDNFVKQIINHLNSNSECKVDSKQKFTPTNCADLSEAIIKLIEKSEAATSLFGKNSAPNFGIYNFSNSGETTLFEVANLISKYGKKYGIVNNDCKILPLEEENVSVERPLYSVLNKDKITKAIKIKIPGWDLSLEKFIKLLK